MKYNIGACSLYENVTVDDLLIGDEPLLTVDEAIETAERNPRMKATWALEWPSKIEHRADYKTGKMREFIRRPAGPFTDSIRGVPVRLKISVELGMMVIDRAWGTTCAWRTPFCTRHCYNKNISRTRPNLKKAAKPDERFWKELTGEWLYDLLHCDRFAYFCEKMGYTPAYMRGRIRLATRGEAFSKPADVTKVADLCKANPATLFWVPTRAWRNEAMANMIEDLMMCLPNARVLASTDPSNTDEELAELGERCWNTMFFGDDTATKGRFKCPKTWKKIKSYCRICKPGCCKNGPVDVHLAVHGTKV